MARKIAINKYLDHVKENLTACSNDSYRYTANKIIKDIGHLVI